MTLTYFGHSAFQLETGDTSILVDPFISDNPLAKGIVSAEDLSPDVILLTHAHGDHVGDTAAIAARSKALVVGSYEVTEYMRKQHNYENLLGMNTGGSWSFDWGRVTVTHARHSSSFPDGTYGGVPHGFIIEADQKTCYAMGDTSPFLEMAWLAEDFDIDLALIPVGDCFTMGPRASIRAADLVKADRFVPIHYNTFPPITIDVTEWENLMKDAGHSSCVLAPGDSIQV